MLPCHGTLKKGQDRSPGDTPARSPYAGVTRRRIGSANGKRNSRPTVDAGRSTLDGTGPGQRQSSPPIRPGAARCRVHDHTRATGKLVDGLFVVRSRRDRSSVQAHQWPCMADGGLLSGVNDQDSPAGNGRDGADILVGPPVLRALLQSHHRAASCKSSATRRADDCTGRQRFGAPQAWEYGTSGRFRQRSGDRHVTSSTSLR